MCHLHIHLHVTEDLFQCDSAQLSPLNVNVTASRAEGSLQDKNVDLFPFPVYWFIVLWSVYLFTVFTPIRDVVLTFTWRSKGQIQYLER